ncbi:MAG: hypothetical protein HYX41_06230, partial [Bdellovibrio sp.]|nr:hypothetical protein [Bdellovibrio sp.]
PAPSGTPTLERDLDLGLNADVLRVSVGRNQYLISIAALPCEEIEGCMRHPTRSVVFYETIWCGVTAKDVFALKSFPAGNNLIAQQLTTYSTQPRHRVSAKALVMLDEIHNLPFETVFGFFVEKDTGTIVCKTVIRGWGRTISVTHKGETFEASFEKAIRKVIRDKDLLIAEDLIRNQPRVFTGLFPGIIRGSSSLAAPVRTFGRVVQMHRSGTLNDPTAIDSLRALAERVNGWQRLEQTEDEEEEVDSTFGMPPNPLMNRK